jgi:hypothetical protein
VEVQVLVLAQLRDVSGFARRVEPEDRSSMRRVGLIWAFPHRSFGGIHLATADDDYRDIDLTYHFTRRMKIRSRAWSTINQFSPVESSSFPPRMFKRYLG